jgi:hypothetical protein
MAATTLLLGACGNDTSTVPDPGDDDQGATATEEALVETEDVTEDDVVDTEEVVSEEDSEAEAEDWSDRPEGYSSLYTNGVEPVLDTTDGEVSIAAMAPPDGTTIPMIVHNGTSELASRVEVTGALVDADGSTITSGNSHGFEPNAVAPGDYGIGYFYAGPDDVPEGASLEQISIDYTTGLGDFEDMLAVDITDVDVTEERATGTLANPHEVEVDGPISVVFACLDDAGSLIGLWSTYADRDSVEAGGSSTFTMDFYSDEVDCAGVIAGGSGYNHEGW